MFRCGFIARNCAIYVTALSLGSCAGFGDVDHSPRSVIIDVPFVTDRAVDDPERPKRYFGGSRGEVRYGVADVALRRREDDGARFRDSPSQGWEGRADVRPDRVVEVSLQDRANFFFDLGQRLEAAPDKSALVYIHGYAKKFHVVAKAAAELAYEIGYQGVPILYSWPSKGLATHYPGDLANIEWSLPHLQLFLEELARQPGLDAVHLVAHSLGNRAALIALSRFAAEYRRGGDWNFGEVVLFAPDVDTMVFRRDILPVLRDTPSRYSMYASTLDVPLEFSGFVNTYPRLGDASKVVVVEPGLETIDVTLASTIFDGHSAHRESRQVQTDLHHLIVERRGAAQRPTLEAVDSEEGRYWRVRAE